jgi:hypothetical protein
MVARFNGSSFNLLEGEQLPEFEEGWPGFADRDENLWHIDGFDTFEGASYPLASNIEDAETARFLAGAAMRNVRIEQPKAGSIQDKVFVIHPNHMTR